ncbi:hypothetical protein ACFOEE_06615 [Pseudoalteromonas fenneropenaei]|uniref:Sulfotransferase n=1 Tax=Pseudoalteromonas fenneropenaei TaxID=1737459 RepID=A0ABV7CHV2_9GAMM
MSSRHTLQRFVILSAPRSGSNMLCSMLQSHSDILCHHEVFNPTGMFYALPLRNTSFSLASSIAERDAAPFKVLEAIWHESMGHNAVGFKMTHQQQPDIFEAVVNDPSIKKIVLKRNNPLQVHVSKLVAEHTGVWENYHSDPEPVRCQVMVNKAELAADIAKNQAYYQALSQCLATTQQTYCAVDYETLLSEATQARILDFLGVRRLRLKAASRKQAPDDLRRVIRNYEQLLASSDGQLKELLENCE